MTTRRPRRLVGVLLGVVLTAGLVSVPSSAWADGFDLCKDAPAPVAPKSGMAGMLTTRPAHIPDQTRDPFTNPKVSIGQVYGYNWAWSNYDLGCGNDFLRDPIAVANTHSANVLTGLLGAGLATLAGLEQLASHSGIGWLTTIVTNTAGTLRGLLLGDNTAGRVGWLPLALIAVGVFVVFRARRADYAATARTLAIVVVAAGLAVFTLLTPAIASRTVDRGVTGLASAAGASFGGSATDMVNRQAGYRTWLAGYFGNPDSPLARQYGPRLVWATHYSWAETAQIQADPSARKGIDRAKAREFKHIADQVEHTSPAAYRVFTGRGDRTGPVILGLVVLVCAGLFTCVAFVMILLARVMMQALVVAAPIAAVAGILPPGHGVLARLWGLFTAGLLAVVKFTLAAGIMSLILGGLAAAQGMPGVEKLVWMITATVVGLVLTKPAQTFKTLMPGLDPGRHYLRDLAGKAVTALAVSKGVTMALNNDNADSGSDSEPGPDDQPNPRPPAPSRRRPALPAGPVESLPPLPPPHWVQVDNTPATDQTTPATAVAPAIARDAAPAGVAEGRRWAGILDNHHTAPHADAVPALPAPPSPAPPSSVPGSPVLALPAGPAARHGLATGADQNLSAGSWDGAGGVHVVAPSGVIIPADPTLYRAGGGPLPGDEVVTITDPEPDTDPDGTEHEQISYHSPHGVRHE